MTSKFDKLDKFRKARNFRRLAKKMHFLLVPHRKYVYVLSTPSPVWSENKTLEATRKRMKWENDDYICRGHILNGMSDSLFDIYQNVESAKALWESLESKYMAEDASAKKFLYTQHNLMMDEAISVAVIIDKLPPSWKEFKHGLKHKKEELNLVQLGSHLRIKEGLRNQELDNNPKGKNQIGSSSVNMVEGDGVKNSKNNKNKRKFKSGDDKFANKKGTMTCWKCNKPGHMKKDCRSRKGKDGAGSNGSKDPEKQQGYDSDFTQNLYNVLHYVSVISDAFYSSWIDEVCLITRQPFKGVNRESKVLDLIHSDLCDFHANPSLGHNKYVITFIDDASRYCYVYLLHAKHEALDKFKIYKQEVELQRQDLIKVLRTDRGGEYYDPVYFQSTGIIHQTTAPYTPQQNGVAERKNRTLKEMVNSMLSYSGLSEGFWGEAMLTAYQNRFNQSSSKIAEDEVEGTDDVPGPSVPRKSTRTRKAKIQDLDEAMDSRDVCLFGKKHSKKMKVDGSIDKYKARLVIQGFRQKEGIDFFDTYAPVARISTIRLLLALAAIHDLVIHQMDMKTAFLEFRPKKETPVSQLEYSRAIGCLMYAMISTRPDIAFAVGKLSRYTSNPSALHWQALGRVFQNLKGTMDYGLTYSGYPSVIEGYSDASWINNMEDHSSTSGWVFLLGGGAISWASKKQTCITTSTMEFEFVALAAAGNEAE
ncbi:zinc finger, CCHC-type containing protein [Tanacetum coccineum]